MKNHDFYTYFLFFQFESIFVKCKGRKTVFPLPILDSLAGAPYIRLIKKDRFTSEKQTEAY